ncbi:MAG: cation transporter [Bacteroidales bacterium]
MKTKILGLVSMFLFGTSMVFAQAKTEKFEVKGNCGMCETRIEKAAKSVDGVSTADWNQETKILVVNLDSTKTTVNKIQLAIAGVGHDTPMHRAKDEVYNKLPACCKYDRKVVIKKGVKNAWN